MVSNVIGRFSERDVQKEVRKVIEKLPRTRNVRDEPGYLHAEFTINDEARRIDFRSAFRVGYYNFGANRKRMEDICRHLAEKDGITRQAT